MLPLRSPEFITRSRTASPLQRGRRSASSQAAATERKRLKEPLAYYAYHDELTGLANRASFLERLEGAIARADREGSGVADLYLDLDRFKEVNASFGHGVGDELLKAMAECLRRAVRCEAHGVARRVGDEFCAMLEGVAAAGEAEDVAARVAPGT